jgi:hypothetical protein
MLAAGEFGDFINVSIFPMNQCSMLPFNLYFNQLWDKMKQCIIVYN